MHTYSRQSSPSPHPNARPDHVQMAVLKPFTGGEEGGGSVHADKCVCECVLGGGLGDVGKTLWQTKVFTSHPDRPTGI